MPLRYGANPHQKPAQIYTTLPSLPLKGYHPSRHTSFKILNVYQLVILCNQCNHFMLELVLLMDIFSFFKLCEEPFQRNSFTLVIMGYMASLYWCTLGAVFSVERFAWVHQPV